MKKIFACILKAVRDMCRYYVAEKRISKLAAGGVEQETAGEAGSWAGYVLCNTLFKTVRCNDGALWAVVCELHRRHNVQGADCWPSRSPDFNPLDFLCLV